MPTKVINFNDKFSLFDQHWSPRVIAEMNDYQFKLVKVEGEFVWHEHADTDEVFIVMEGTLQIAFRDQDITLQAGEMFVIPKGVEHKPMAKKECKIMIIEPRGVVNTGEIDSDRTALNDQWI
ncbi:MULTISPECIES: cupin domain-containing protein [unclassified Shewanella]|jgi:mannose-6-phosphate isomerase-like protein (cupin superfamily)|uniref:cupin domain-containing protein n=1 Tax=unclassified Shewanella TaxID=196818 RepID=UPI000C34CACA|nr:MULTISPECIES: cupin domain-containing protein [unclassified Shewanella]MBB1363762.1 cupin domain-containing protein [Shewanella sp. SR44-4]MBO1897450.1 cupin domain-containing protein [Shewanella sp. BF02_Schw]PKH34610.1 cupin [Shewanella sp. ALD9]|tara:strand:- start:115 stop:480 length:366 start_codon:yes stop_codon:yes gene_type:complete